jgi:hypothetical protein
MKTCIGCKQSLDLSAFYGGNGPNRDAFSSRCRKCFNAACVERVRKSPARRAQQYQSKRRWYLGNPDRKAIHEGRTVFLQNPEAPAGLVQLEKLVLNFNRAIAQKRKAETV